MSTGSPRLSLLVGEDIAEVVVDNAAEHNSLHRSDWVELQTLPAEAQRAGATVLLLRTARPPFISGGTLEEIRSLSTEDQLQYLDDVEAALVALERSPLPTLACVSGRCVGAGLTLMTLCSYAIASEDAVFEIPAARAGIYTDSRQIARLALALGTRVARAVLFGAQISSARALSCGLIDEAVPDLDLDSRVAERARQLARLDRGAVRHLNAALERASGALHPPPPQRQPIFADDTMHAWDDA